MTKEELKQSGEALIALAEGKPVQIKSRYGRDEAFSEWRDYDYGEPDPCPDFESWLWRVKPEQKRRLITPDELPPVFWIRTGAGGNWYNPIFISEAGFGIHIDNSAPVDFVDWHRIEKYSDCWHWSPDRKEVRSFWVED